MTNYVDTREAIARAACDVAGIERPLESMMPTKDRIYLFSSPEGPYSVDALRSALQSSSLRSGVDWDRNSETFGLHFVRKAEKLPENLLGFTSDEARKSWRSFRLEMAAMAAAVTESALELVPASQRTKIPSSGKADFIRPRRKSSEMTH